MPSEHRSSILSSWAHLPPPPEGATENDIKRRLIVQSLVKTEKSYISSLETIENDYRRRLLTMKILDPSVVNEMFAGVNDILERHRMFGNALDSGTEIKICILAIYLHF